MKTINFRTVKVFFLLFLMFFSAVGMLKAQNLLKYGVPPVTTNYIDHDGSLEFGTGNLGIGIFPANARLHVRTTGFPNQPLFNTEIWGTFTEEMASIQHFVTKGLTQYAIYQSDPAELGLLNYFQDPLQIGYIKIGNDQNKTKFETSYETESIIFKMWTSAPNPFYPLKIVPFGISVTGFQLTSNPGLSKILASDADGNGSWTDASFFNDQDWLETGSPIGKEGGPPPPEEQKSLYLNTKYLNVGIGTPDPVSKLHVMDGNILISRSRPKAPGSVNGSILFGEVVSDEFPRGEWGIEYFNPGSEFNTGGLNFWKVASANGLGANYCLFIKNNGNVGVGSSAPIDKFQVNDGFEKLAIGSANLEALGSGTSYVGYNAARTRGGDENDWLFETNKEYNGGNITYGDLEGNYHIVTVPSTETGTETQKITDDEVLAHIRMTVTKEGDVGIGTRSPGVALDVNKNGETKIRTYASGPFISALWATNSLGGFGFLIDENGIGHIEECNPLNPEPQSIITFYNGRVGIGCADLNNIPGLDDHELFVEGGITTEEINVSAKFTWYDHVFSANYKLLPILELEKVIKSDQHLPDIPTEKEVKANGINLGEMNALLLKKVEELTLYIIDQQKQINALNDKIELKR